MSDLAAFLLARIEDDEAIARGALYDTVTGPPHTVVEVDDGKWSVGDHEIDECGVTGVGITIYDEGGHNAEQARHIARHDPARVLAECAARRQIVAIHEHDRDPVFCVMCQWEGDEFCPTLRALAQPYADHPDFRDEWQA